MIKKFSLSQNTYDIRMKLNPGAKFYLVKILHGMTAAFSSADTVVRKEINVIPPNESYELVSGSNLIMAPMSKITKPFMGEVIDQISVEKNGVVYLWCEGDNSALEGYPRDKEVYKEPCYESLIEKYVSGNWEVFDIRHMSDGDEDYYGSYFFFDAKSRLVPSDD